jgi:hypothetical protein
VSRLAAAAVVLGLALAGCGSSEAQDALGEATGKLGEIESGVLRLKVAAEPSTMGDSAIGFELDGPFALAGAGGELPRAEMAYTQIAGPNRAEVGFISSGEAAWVEVEGQAYELPPEQVERLRAGDGEGGGPLAELDVASWTRDAKLSEGSRVDGQATERVRGSVDVAEAINDLARVLEQTGGGEAVQGLTELEDEDAEQVGEAVRSAPIEIVFGKQDRLLRRLRVTLDFAIEPRELRGGLGRLSGAKVTLDLHISEPNGEVRIEEPVDALPYDQLPAG